MALDNAAESRRNGRASPLWGAGGAAHLRREPPLGGGSVRAVRPKGEPIHGVARRGGLLLLLAEREVTQRRQERVARLRHVRLRPPARGSQARVETRNLPCLAGG
eukprot:3256679-Pyramimonas_sp.AAC.1